MRSRSNQVGFSIIELVIVIAAVVLLGVLGFVMYGRLQGNKPATTSEASDQSTTASGIALAPSVNSTDDLDAAQAVLDKTDPDNNTTDTGQLDSELAAF